MGYYVSNMFGIRTGGVFSDKADQADMVKRVNALASRMNTEEPHCVPEEFTAAISAELEATKGAYVVIAGVFNYWTYSRSSKFASALSAEFVAEVMHMCWDEQVGQVQCQIWLNGTPLLEQSENPIGQVLRRVAG